ncbi:SGNH/GDSL hydrolase family protein [Fangia hongkongensis]|uniref:SGNH/GDSL hydrolase family protein n=3 Tax=Fangia hongkongensis TaxID=270495 RepID=UPI000367E81B|nr:SGNH/GDSL hydrolase family protein [Fangia hongkongensis]
MKKLLCFFIAVLVVSIAVIVGIIWWQDRAHHHEITQRGPELYTNVIVFGDSLSDSADYQSDDPHGNNYWVQPAGILSPKGAPITSEISKLDHKRKTWFNYFVNLMPLRTEKRIYTIRELKNNLAYHHNVSFAVASAETGNNFITDTTSATVADSLCTKGVHDYGSYNCVPGVLKQVHMYLENVNYKPNPQSLFIIWAGGNDFYQNIVRMMTQNGQAISHPIDNIVQAVQLLIDQGVPAHHIYVLNLPNFSMVPAVRGLLAKGIQSPLMFNGALHVVSWISDIFNLTLKANLVLHTFGQFKPSHVFPLDQLFLDVYYNKHQLQARLKLNKEVGKTCAESDALPVCSGFLFYNIMHPTTNIHHYLAKRLYEYMS